MSAFMCDDDTFDYLAGLLRTQRTDSLPFVFPLQPSEAHTLTDEGILTDRTVYGLHGSRDTEALIGILRRENVRSLVARYGKRASEDVREAAGYVLRPVPSDEVDPVVALKSLACLDYQSCERDDYDKSTAKRLIDALTAYAITVLPGYESAPWGWTRADAATAAKAAAAPTAAADWNF